VTISEKVSNIVDQTFYSCSKLTTITVDGANSYFSDDGGVLFDKDKKVLIRYPQGKTDPTYTTTYAVETIGPTAFTGCSYLTSVTIPTSVTEIGGQAFYYCNNLTSITIPENVEKIGYLAFSDCGSLATISVDGNNTVYSSIDDALFDKTGKVLITYPGGKIGNCDIPDGVEEIGISAFANSSVTSVTIPASVKKIEMYAFNCFFLTDVTVKWTEPLAIIDDSRFLGDWLYSYTLHVPTGTKDKYDNANANVWKDFGTILDDVTIGGTAGGSLTWSLSGDTLTIRDHQSRYRIMVTG
jgi:hypothetical protein